MPGKGKETNVVRFWALCCWCWRLLKSIQASWVRCNTGAIMEVHIAGMVLLIYDIGGGVVHWEKPIIMPIIIIGKAQWKKQIEKLKNPCVVHSNTPLKDLEMICRIQVAVSKYKAWTQNKAECDNVTEESRWHLKWQEDNNPEESWLYQGKWKDEVWEAKKAD